MQPRWLADSRGQQEDLEGTDPLPQVRRLQMEAVHRPGAVQGPTGGPHHLQAGPAELRADIVQILVQIHTYIYISLCVKFYWAKQLAQNDDLSIILRYHLFHSIYLN
jgi:hypothetical protein